MYRKTLFEAICHGLNLHREDIISPLSPKEVISKSAQKISIEIESYIGSRIIPIYTAIIDFASQIESHLELNDAQRKSVTKLKQIVRDSLHILHNVQQFRHEMTAYADSPNEAIKLQFDRLRMQLVILLRSYRHWHPELPHDDPRQFLKALKQEAKKQDIELVASIDHLIRQQAITADMGVSLINCSSYILHISQSLINAVKILSNVAEDYNELDQLLVRKLKSD